MRDTRGGAAAHLEKFRAPLLEGARITRSWAVSPRSLPRYFGRPDSDSTTKGNKIGTANCTRTPPPLVGSGSSVGARGDALTEMPSVEPRAQLAFKDSMIRGILQFTLGIAFRCVLHRCRSQDIRC